MIDANTTQLAAARLTAIEAIVASWLEPASPLTSDQAMMRITGVLKETVPACAEGLQPAPRPEAIRVNPLRLD